MFSFDPDKVDNNEIGHGSYGKVYAYKENPQENERFVVKVAHPKKFSDLLGFIQEIVLGFSCDHTNVLPVRGYHIDYDQKKKCWDVYIKLDRMKCSFKSRINEQRLLKKRFSQEEIVNYFYEMSCGLEYLHNRGIAHRDIHPANILISENEEIKIADLGSGKFVGDERSLPLMSITGTYCYTAPEILQNPHLKKKDFFQADVWSLGVVVAEMCLLELGIVDVRVSGRESEQSIFRKLKELEEKQIYDKILLDLIASLIKDDPEKRKSLRHIQETLREKFKYQSPEQEKIHQLQHLIENNLKNFQKELKGSFEINFEGNSGADIKAINSGATEDQVKRLAQKIGSNLKLIKHLSIDFGISQKKITDNEVIELARQIGSNLKSLQHLSLNFYDSQNITDNGVIELAQQIGSKLKNLQRLSIDFSCSKEITNNTIEKFVRLVPPKLKNTKNLEPIPSVFKGSTVEEFARHVLPNFKDTYSEPILSGIQKEIKYTENACLKIN